MADVVGVCFKPTGKVYYFSAKGLELQAGDRVVAETTKGQELAEVVSLGAPGRGRGSREKLKPILRVASDEDTQNGEANKQRADEARRVCQRLLAQLELAVKLVDVEYAFDASRITFSFASEEKTDFRELRRRLKEIYDCAVEMRQIGVRDQAKLLGGLGPCGRQLCCASFLRGFQPVTIKMAKDQDLSLNPTKISGQCGRLMCCLRYEHESYIEAKAIMPKVGATVETPEGSGRVTSLDLLNRSMTVDTAVGPIKLGIDELGSEGEARPERARPQPTRDRLTSTRPSSSEQKVETRERRTRRSRDQRLEGTPETETEKPSRRRSRRRPAREERAKTAEAAPATEEQKAAPPAEGQTGEKPKTRRRRPRRRSRRRGASKATETKPDGGDAPKAAAPPGDAPAKDQSAAKPEGGDAPKTKRRRRRRPRRRRGGGNRSSGGDGGQKSEGGGGQNSEGGGDKPAAPKAD